ncbi:MAG: rhodanese-like domain-containing protein [Prolixibacteraceae bacterium]
MRIKIALYLIPLGMIIAAVPENKTKPYKLTANQMLEQVKEGIQFVSTDQIADMIVQQDPSLQLIDLRSSEDYDKFHLPGAINIPISMLLSEDWEAYINQDVKMNVFYSNGNTIANEAWMISRQLGYVNNYVMMGGLNYWAETIMNPEKPASTSPNDEFAKYDFRKGASQALGGGSLESTQDSGSSAPPPPIQARPKKKRVAGGC